MSVCKEMMLMVTDKHTGFLRHQALSAVFIGLVSSFHLMDLWQESRTKTQRYLKAGNKETLSKDKHISVRGVSIQGQSEVFHGLVRPLVCLRNSHCCL